MKKITALVIITITILLITALYLFRSSNQQNLISLPKTPTTGSQNTNLNFCKQEDLDAKMELQGAAGSIYGTLSIKNTSGKTCQIVGNNFITPDFETQKITVKNEGQVGPLYFTLSPNQTIYSQIHYPNGPQCSSQVLQTSISFNYKISSGGSVVFKNQNNDTKQDIGVCELATELTEVQVWSLSEKPGN